MVLLYFSVFSYEMPQLLHQNIRRRLHLHSKLLQQSSTLPPLVTPEKIRRREKSLHRLRPAVKTPIKEVRFERHNRRA